MVPPAEADFLIVLADDEVETNRCRSPRAAFCSPPP